MNRYLLFFLLLLLTLPCQSQGSFDFYGYNKKHQDVKFQLINNLIVFPLEVNEKKLNFILDTGVNKTIVFNASKTDSTLLRNQKRIKLQGLGSGAPVEAVLSENNRFRIGNLIGNNQKVFIIIDGKFDLSAKMGITIHGVIGYELFKNTIANINYRKKTIRFYNPKLFDESIRCRKCETFPITLHNNKPYLDASIKLGDYNSDDIPVRMLIDTGGSDALWIFEYSDPRITTPDNYFNDILGLGLSGTIMGKRSRIPRISIGNFAVNNPTISYLDTISSENARRYKLRNGSIGSNVLKRFKVWIDYGSRELTLKKTSSLSNGFEYNMSGLGVVYDGKVLVREAQKEVQKDSYGKSLSSSSANNLSVITNYTYRFKPNFKVNTVAKGSPADLAGVRVNDILLKINGEPTYDMTLNEITSKFRQKENKRIRLNILRNKKQLKIEFRLKRRL